MGRGEQAQTETLGTRRRDRAAAAPSDVALQCAKTLVEEQQAFAQVRARASALSAQRSAFERELTAAGRTPSRHWGYLELRSREAREWFELACLELELAWQRLHLKKELDGDGVRPEDVDRVFEGAAERSAVARGLKAIAAATAKELKAPLARAHEERKLRDRQMMSADLDLSAAAPAPGGAPSPAEQRHALNRLGKAQRAKEDWAGKAAAVARERQARRLLIEAAGGEPTADFEFLDSWSRELGCRIEAVIEYRLALEWRREIVEMIERGARLEEVAQSQAELEAIARWRKLGRGPAERELERAMDALVRLNDRQGKIERLKAKLAG